MSSSRLTLMRLQVSISVAGVVFLLAMFSLDPVGLTKSRRKPSPPKTSANTEARHPTPPTPAVGQTRTIVLNSGYDQGLPTPALIDVGKLDNEWRVIADTVNGTPQPPATGRSANVVPDSSWNLNPLLAGNFPSSRWISVTPLQGQPLPNPPPTNKFQYAYYFTLPDGFTNPVLTLKLLADDQIAKVTLNSTILFQGAGGRFYSDPLVLPSSPLTSANFNSGPTVNVLTVEVEDTFAGSTGLIVDGQVTYIVNLDPSELSVDLGTDGRLVIRGTPGVDDIILRLDPTGTKVEVDNRTNGAGPDYSFDLTLVHSIHISLGAGDDRVIFDDTNGSLGTLRPLEADVGEGDNTFIGSTGSLVPGEIAALSNTILKLKKLLEDASQLRERAGKLTSSAGELAAIDGGALTQLGERFSADTQNQLIDPADALRNDADREIVRVADQLIRERPSVLQQLERTARLGDRFADGQASSFIQRIDRLVAKASRFTDDDGRVVQLEERMESEIDSFTLAADDLGARLQEDPLQAESSSESRTLELEQAGNAFLARAEQQLLGGGNALLARSDQELLGGGNSLLSRADTIAGEADAIAHEADVLLEAILPVIGKLFEGTNSLTTSAQLAPVGCLFTTTNTVTGSGLLIGTSVNDLLVGGTGNDIMFGGGGNDRMRGGAGNDVMFGNSGGDDMYGEADSDFMFGNQGDDCMDGGADTDLMFGNQGDDTMDGYKGQTAQDACNEIIIQLGNGNTVKIELGDVMWGNQGSDTMNGSNCVDLMFGNAGLDQMHGNSGMDFMFGNTDNDQMWGDPGGGLFINNNPISPPIGNFMFGNTGNDQMSGGVHRDSMWGNEDNDTMNGDGDIDFMYGNQGSDTISGDNGADFIWGNQGSDTIHGNDGTDILWGNDDSDTMNGDAGTDVLWGNQGIDTMHGNDGTDLLYGNEDNDAMNGNDGTDFIFGNQGADTMHGNDGLDFMYGNQGADTMSGDAGADFMYGNDDNDTMNGNDGLDFMFGNQGADTMSGDAGADFMYGNDDNDTMNGNDGIDIMSGNRGDDTMHGDAGADLMYGNEDNDTMNGNNGVDSMWGNQGNDTMHGNDDTDSMFGNQGDDTMHGDAGADLMYGNEGNDTMNGNDANDLMFGNDGNDCMDGGNGNDLMYGNQGNDRMFGGPSSGLIGDLMFGNEGEDCMDGGAGSDKMFGNQDNDTMLGGDANDLMFGNEGNDLLEGGNGNDIMEGNQGNDTMYGGAGNDGMFGNQGNDTMFGGPSSGLIGDIMFGGGGSDTRDQGGPSSSGVACQSCAPVVVGTCDREIKKTVTPNPVQSGQQVTTTLTVTNLGTAPCGVVGGINVADVQPAGLTFQLPVLANRPGWSCGFSGPGIIVYCLSTSPLLPGAANALTITFGAKVTASAGSAVQNCAEVTNVGDSVQTNNKTCVLLNVN